MTIDRRTRLQASLLCSTAAMLCMSTPALAQDLAIDGGASETVDGSGDGTTGTIDSPLDITGVLSVGRDTNGTLNIVAGGSVSSANGQIASSLGSIGTVTVDGGGSTWTTDYLEFGFVNVFSEGGKGRLAISNGGNVGSGYSSISSGAVTVDGQGSTWTTGTIDVGYVGKASLLITDGGAVKSSSNGFIGGSFPGSDGTVTVDGMGSNWAIRGELYVGLEGTGILTVANGGEVVASVIRVANRASRVGTVNIGAAAGDAATGAGIITSPTLAFGAGTGTLVFNHTDSAYAFSTNISGLGSLEHYAGETILTGTNTYTGPTTIDGGTLVVGDGGTIAGTSDITIASNAGDIAGMVVRANNGGGTVDMTGNIVVGDGGTGNLAINDGGSVNNAFGIIGFSSGSDGTVTVDGVGSTWTASSALIVGLNGTGSLAITNGGSVNNNTNGNIGGNGGSIGTVTVDGTDSNWTNSAALRVGLAGTGSLTISNGGSVSSGFGYIGQNAGSVGTVKVDGASSIWTNSGDLTVGLAGTGSLTVANGGEVSAAALIVADQAGSVGTVNIGAAAGDAAAAAGTINASTLTFGAGTGTLVFNHTGNAYAFAPSISGVGSLEHYAGQTILTGTNTYTGPTAIYGGTLLVGDGGTIAGNSNISIAPDADNIAGMVVRADNGGGTVSTIGNLFVGFEGFGSLAISDGGSVSNTFSYIGFEEDSVGTVTVDGTNSSWSSSTDLTVGLAGTGSLAISGGGSVSNNGVGYIGLNADSTGTVTVEGAGSNWDSRFDLNVGIEGAGSLAISDGANVSNNFGFVGLFSSSIGTVTVDGLGSTWTNRNFLAVGLAGTGSLSITDGGRVSNALGYIGTDVGKFGAVTVDGLGSTWTNSDDLTVGLFGKGSLTVANGGEVSAPGLVVAAYDGSVGTINIGAAAGDAAAGAGILSAPTLEFGSGAGKLVFNHTDSDYSFASSVTGAGSVDHYTGETILTGTNTYTGPTAIYGGTVVVGDGGTIAGTSNISIAPGADDVAAMVVRADNSGGTVTTNGDLIVGGLGQANLAITDGGSFGSDQGIIGLNTVSIGTVTVDGANSSWTNSRDLFVGGAGQGSLAISAGGSVSNANGFIGFKTGSTGAVTVEEAGSILTNDSAFYVGYEGKGSLDISAGGSVINTDGVIGFGANSVGTVTVGGANSTWTNSDQLLVGFDGKGSLAISGGGSVTSTFSIVGFGGESRGTITVEGAGSTWTNQLLFLGRLGIGNLAISNGGNVSTTTSAIGITAQSLGRVTVEGTNSTWTNSGELFVGREGTGSLAISNGGTVSSNSGYIGYNTGSVSTLSVDGTGSNWTSGILYVGVDGNGNLAISDGGTVSSSSGTIGFFSGSDSTVSISGAGSIWTNSGDLYVGESGRGSLTVANGGEVSAAALLVANQAGSFGTVNIGSAAGDTAAAAGLISAPTLDFGAGTGALVFNHTDSGYAFTASVNGAGSLSHYAGETILTGTNTYTGRTKIDGGTLVVGDDGTLLGTSQISIGENVGDDAIMIVSSANGGGSVSTPGDLYVGIAGTGNLMIRDGGSVDASGSYIGIAPGSTGMVSVNGTGSSLVHSDILAVGFGGDGALDIIGGGQVSNLTATIGVFSGSTGAVTVSGMDSKWTSNDSLLVGLRGTGTLEVSGGGSVTSAAGYLGGFSGSVGSVMVTGAGSSWINGGDLFVGTEGAGTLTVADSGTVSAGGGAGNVSVALAAGSAGTINIGAAAGDPAAGAGFINAASLVFGDGTGTLVFNHTDSDYVFDLDMGGTGSIEHYAGTTTFTGNGSGLTGTTDILGGTVFVSGILGGSTLVGDGALLGGAGLLGTVSVGNGATISPGNSIGTLSIAGDLTFDAGSIFEVEVDPSSSASDLIAVGGAVTINGGNVAHIGFSGDYLPTSTYTIISAGGGVTGAFDGVTSSFAFLDPILGYAPTAVTLTLQRNDIDFSTVAITPNQLQVASAVQGLGFGNPVFDAAVFLSEEEASGAFDLLSGEIHPAMRTSLAEDNRLVRQVVIDQVVRASGEHGAWGELIGNNGKNDGSNGTADIDRDMVGFVGGADVALGENALVGLAGGYTESDVDLARRQSSGKAKTIHVLAYVGLRSDALRMRAGLGYSHSKIDTLRDVTFTGFAETLSASYDGETMQAFGELGYELAVGAGKIAPYVGLSATRIKIDGITELGGAAALTGESSKQTTTVGTLGANFSTDLDKPFRIEGMLGWAHAFSGYDSNTVLALAGSQPFDIAAASQSRDAVLMDASGILEISDMMTLNLSYRGAIGSNGEDHALTGGLRLRF